MRSSSEWFDEETLGDVKDLKLLKIFTPFLGRVWGSIVLSVFLVILIAALDLMLPYITKYTVDNYIVPVIEEGEDIRQKNMLSFKIMDKKGEEIINKYPDLFVVNNSDTQITYKNLKKLDKDEVLHIRHKHVQGIIFSAIFLLLVAISRFFTNFLQLYTMNLAGQKIMHDLRNAIFSKLMSLSVTFFSKNKVGRLVTRVTGDVQNMQEMFTSILTNLIKDLFILIGIVIILFAMNVTLALYTMMIIPLVIFISFRFAEKSRGIFRELRIKVAEINSKFSETISGIKIIHLFRKEISFQQDFNKTNHDNFLAGLTQIRIFGSFMPLIELLGSISVAIIIYYGGTQVISEMMSLGTLIAFISYMKMFFKPVRDIAEKHNILQNALASAERVGLILESRETEPDSRASIEINQIDSITFKDVVFSYTSDMDIIKGVSFSLKKGESIAIVGPTGSGKTTLINLIIKFYSYQSGTIEINDLDLKLINTDSLRSKIALVTQDPFLFSGTIHDNIFPPDKEISDNKIQRILELSYLNEVLVDMPMGLNTVISNDGTVLSSGEKQLVSIARAFACDPDLIIFDEATSYIDTKFEDKIRNSINNLKTMRTSITIAHRLLSAVSADTILVMENGKITESGNHETLMHKKGYYFSLIPENNL